MGPFPLLACTAWLLWWFAASATRRPLTQIISQGSAPMLATTLKVPGESPAYYCSDPHNDTFQIQRLDFIPTNVRIGFYTTIRFIGNFTSSTGDGPWLNITGTINGRAEREPLYNSLLCDIDVFQEIVPPGHEGEKPRMHRSCPSSTQRGYAVVSPPPMPLTPQTVPEGLYDLRAEATTQDGLRLFCVEGKFNVTE